MEELGIKGPGLVSPAHIFASCVTGHPPVNMKEVAELVSGGAIDSPIKKEPLAVIEGLFTQAVLGGIGTPPSDGAVDMNRLLLQDTRDEIADLNKRLASLHVKEYKLLEVITHG